MSDKPAASKSEAPKAEAGKPAADAAPAGGGMKAWLPLILAVVLMPVLAWVTTSFVIVPKVLKARETPAGHESEEPEAAAHDAGGEHAADDKHESGKDSHAKEPKKDAHGKDGAKGKKKQNYQISKLIVNVAGSMGTRYLMTSATLVGTKPDFKDLIEENKDQLLDLTIGVLSTKTINDLEKPGARNQIRSELISVYNNALGSGLVQEIYFTEFAIQ